MTGQDVKTALNTQIGELGLGYFNDARLSAFLKKAIVDIIDKKVQEFQKSNKITREDQPLITLLPGVTPVNATIDVSQTSTAVPDYYELISLICYTPFMGSTIKKVAKERRADQFISPSTEGTARYPRYFMTNGIITIEPDTATSVDLVYFIKPFYIDVTDNATEIPYNDKLIQRIIDGTIGVIGFETRDPFSIEQSNQMQAINP